MKYALVVLVGLLMASSNAGAETTAWPAAEIGCGDWSDSGARARLLAARRMAESLPGYDQVRRLFKIEELDIDCSIPEPPALRIRLRAKASGLSTGIEWRDPLQCCWEPSLTWESLLEIYRAGSAVLSQHDWLGDWVRRGRGNEVRILARGTSGVDDSEGELQTYVLPSWRLAGFAGVPAYEVLLRRHAEDPAAIMFFAAVDSRALITITWPADRPVHWLDEIDVHSHPMDAPCWDYVTVTSRGDWNHPRYEETAGCKAKQPR